MGFREVIDSMRAQVLDRRISDERRSIARVDADRREAEPSEVYDREAERRAALALSLNEAEGAS